MQISAKGGTIVLDYYPIKTWSNNIIPDKFILDERFKKEFPTLNNTFTVDKGRKYYRVWSIDNQKTIHCFVNIKTGDVFKPESYNKPAKHVRYNLLDEDSRVDMFSRAHYAGGYLYLR